MALTLRCAPVPLWSFLLIPLGVVVLWAFPKTQSTLDAWSSKIPRGDINHATSPKDKNTPELLSFAISQDDVGLTSSQTELPTVGAWSSSTSAADDVAFPTNQPTPEVQSSSTSAADAIAHTTSQKELTTPEAPSSITSMAGDVISPREDDVTLTTSQKELSTLEAWSSTSGNTSSETPHRGDVAPATEQHDAKPETVEVKRSRPFFLFWTGDLSTRADTLFTLELAMELASLGCKVVVEGVSYQALPAEYRQDTFTIRANPRLRLVLSGQNDTAWNAISAIDGEMPQYIVCFSSLWAPFFFQLPHGYPDVRLVWYFYSPLSCNQSQDQGCCKRVTFNTVCQ